jgi:hypothetical protein
MVRLMMDGVSHLVEDREPHAEAGADVLADLGDGVRFYTCRKMADRRFSVMVM